MGDLDNVKRYDIDRLGGFHTAEGDYVRLKDVAAFLLQKDERIAALVATQKPRGGEEWHERHGTVLWFTEPIDEPPYCGTPLDQDFPWVSTRIEKLLWVPLPAIFNREVDRG